MAELLEASGVDTVVELSRRNPDNLHVTMRDMNEQKKTCQASTCTGSGKRLGGAGKRVAKSYFILNINAQAIINPTRLNLGPPTGDRGFFMR